MSLPNSAGYVVVAGMLAAIGAQPELATLPLVRNPRRPQHLGQGARVLILSESADKLVKKNGALERRQRSVSVGALTRGPGADGAADALYQLLSDTIQAGLDVMSKQGIVVQLSERLVQFHVDDLELDVDGAIVIGGWEIDYLRARPRTT